MPLEVFRWIEFKVLGTLLCLKVGAQTEVNKYSTNSPFKNETTLSQLRTDVSSIFFSINICM